MKTNKMRLILVLAGLLLFGCSQINSGLVNTKSTPTENPMQLLEQSLTETPTPRTIIVTPIIDTAIVPTALVQETSYPLYVIFPDGSQISLSSDELEALPKSTILLKDSQQETGTPLLTILDAVGWSKYQVNTISVQGDGLIKLSKAQLDASFILITGNLNIRFAAPLIPRADWLSEVKIIVLN